MSLIEASLCGSPLRYHANTRARHLALRNMAILTVGGLFFEPLIGIPTKLSGLDVPDAGSLSVLIWAPGIALFS